MINIRDDGLTLTGYDNMNGGVAKLWLCCVFLD